MYWKIEALTAKRNTVSQTIEGSLEDVKAKAMVYGLEILDVSPDYKALFKSVFYKRQLSSSLLAMFFSDFADMQKCGLSVAEALNTLNETSSHVGLKEALRNIVDSINDGQTLEEAFGGVRIFPKMVSVTLSAAEKTGNIPELLDLLSQYYKFSHENNKMIVKSLIYPAIVFGLLTLLSIFISMTLVPQLSSFLPPAGHNLFAVILINYANFIKQYWWVVVILLGIGSYAFKYFWDNKRDGVMGILFKFPFLGAWMKNACFSHVFLNLYIYQKSGVNIIQTITHIHQANENYVTDKLLLVRDRIFRGDSLGEAFRKDSFFPPFICQNLAKGQVNGFLPQYLERIYRYYDIKFKESIGVMVSFLGPLLLAIATLFLLMIVYAFILPIYTNLNQMGSGVFS